MKLSDWRVCSGVAFAAVVAMHCASATTVPRWPVEEREEAEARPMPPAVSMGGLPEFTAPAGSGRWVPIGPAPIASPFAGVGIANGRVTAVAVSPADERIVLMGADGGGIWRSEDGGATFRFVAETDGAVPAIELSPADPQVAYATADGDFSIGASRSLYDGSFLRSTDGGRTWSKRGVPYTHSSFPGMLYSRIRPDPRDRDRVLINTFGAVWSSPDGGQTWSPVLSCSFCDVAYFPADPSVWLVFRNDMLTSIAIAVDDDSVIYTASGTDRVMRSSDGGATWTDVSNGVPAHGLPEVKAVLALGRGNTALLGLNTYRATQTLLRTDDGGAVWKPVAGFPPVAVQALYSDGVEPGVVYAGTDAGVFRSPDAGVTWSLHGSGLPRRPVSGLTRTADGRMIAATYGRGAYVYAPPAPPKRRAIRH